MMHKPSQKWLFAIGLWAAVALAHSADRFSYSSSGSEVTDNATGLTWRRCAEGMTWSGSTCMGSASTYTHEGALQQAQGQSQSSGQNWRLPNVKELSSIVDDSRINPAIDTTAFPNTPNSWFWTSSPYVGDSYGAWDVNFYDGFVGGNGRSSNYYVRLVR